MFNQKYFPYVRAVSQLQSSNALGSITTGSIVAFAVATAIARCLPVECVAGDVAAQHFNNNLMLRARERVAEFNEVAPMAYDQAVDLVKKIWLQREFNCSGKLLPLHFQMDYFQSISGVGVFFSPEEISFATQYSQQILELASVCAEIECAAPVCAETPSVVGA